MNTLSSTPFTMKTPLIIDRPDLQPWQQKAVFSVATVAFWLLWFWLWLPLVTLAGWLFFGNRFGLHMIALDGYKGFLGTLAVYGVVILCMGGSLLLWAKYNHLRFRDLERRKSAPVPTLGEMSALLGHSENAIATWRAASVVTVHHDAHGGIQRVHPHRETPPPVRRLPPLVTRPTEERARA